MYFDFSGYSEMALGLARMVGIKLPMNFNSPLKALSVVEYWARWHITLTRFLTAYIYNPIALRLARRRAAAGKSGVTGAHINWAAFSGIVALPTVVTMLLSGLWHGAGNQFLVFGALHGAALVINHAWRLVRPRFWPDTAHYQRTTRPIAWALTFLVVIVALTWFHAASVASGGSIVAGMIGLHGLTSSEEMGDLAMLYGWIVVLLAIALVPPNVLEIMRPWQPAITMPGTTASGRLDLWRGLALRLSLSMSPVWAFAAAIVMTIGVLSLNRVSEFLYWRF
jgi:D-alanyl-lipoteichoic acid acyltransferase DltB (MBOAT superfamily)